MESKSIKKFDKGVQYSLLLTLELDFNLKEERLFDNCIDSEVKVDPKKFCLETISTEMSFEFWTAKEIDQMCKVSAT